LRCGHPKLLQLETPPDATLYTDLCPAVVETNLSNNNTRKVVSS